MLLGGRRDYPGALVVVEGIDGSGKSTQLYLLKRWLEIGGYRIHFTEWNSSPLVKSATKRGKQRRSAHACHIFADSRRRFRRSLRTPDSAAAARRLSRSGRPIYLHGVRAGRGAGLLRQPGCAICIALRRFPDLTFYFRAPLDVAVDRIIAGRPRLKYYEAGMDSESFAGSRGEFPNVPSANPGAIRFDGGIGPIRRHGRDTAGEQTATAHAGHLAEARGSCSLRAEAPRRGARMKRETPPQAARSARHRGSAAARKEPKKIDPAVARFYGTPLPGVKAEGLGGTLIVLEGTDGSGRSTQISLLTEWLESQGLRGADDGAAAIVSRCEGHRHAAGRKHDHADDADADVRDRLFRSARAPDYSRDAFGFHRACPTVISTR